jgi:hypothetical protein
MVKKICYSCNIDNIITSNNQTNEIYLCYDCNHNKIYKTDCIKQYKLTEDDLADLHYGEFTNRRILCTYYYKPEVINILLQKYGPNYETIIQQYKNNKKNKQENNKQNREQKIKTMFFENNINYNEYQHLNIIKNYLSNGKNIKNIIKYISNIDKRKKSLNEKLLEYNLEPDNIYCHYYVYGINDNNDIYNIVSNIDNVINKLREMRRRKMILEIKFMLNEIELRTDSTICKNFINGCDDYTIDEIAKIMKEMKFYYEETNYSSILKNVRHKYIGEQRQYGWYEHDDDNEEIVRENAKKIAMNEYIKKNKVKPNFTLDY